MPASIRMKIIHIISGLGLGGAETTLLNLVKNTQGSSVSHAVISLSSLDTLANDLRIAGAEVRILGMNARIPSPARIVQLIKWIIELRPDVVQTWMYHADLFGGIAARIARIALRSRSVPRPFVIAWGIHRTEVPIKHSAFLRILVRLCALSSHFIPDIIIFCAEAAYKSHCTFGYKNKLMKIIRNGFDTKQFSPNPKSHNELTAALGLPNETVLIGIVGRFNPAKDFDNFFRASTILASRSMGCHFVMVGNRVDRNNEALVAYADGPELKGKVHLLGARRDIPNLMPGFDILCLSSRTEGFPTVVGEAMACGVPCVVTDVGDTATLVGNTGIVVPPVNSNALADGLERMVLMPNNERKQLGIQARSRILDEYSIEACWKRYQQAYESAGKQ
ncbi:glycosyl transferase [Burkholderia pseudomultivorans]|uniref:Glycosyl transferase n=2 Tax=Burkholderia pseudomultivorans TaxID=1207504 RepID=A0A6P2R730_9BURK|nr:glycosyl transferase [Burkholderia pseudomultivorans]